MKAVCQAVLILLMIVALSPARAQEEPLPAATEYEPKGGKGRVVVVLSGSTGPNSYTNYARDLAGQGYYTVLLDSNDFRAKTSTPGDILKRVISRALQSPFALPGKVV